jgi:hypothetical protein
LDTGFIDNLSLHFLITIYSMALSRIHHYSLYNAIAISQLQSHTVQFTTRTDPSRSAVSSPVLWYRFSTADDPLPGFPKCSHPTATATHCALLIFWNFLLFFRSVFSGALQITDWQITTFLKHCPVTVLLELCLIID